MFQGVNSGVKRDSCSSSPATDLNYNKEPPKKKQARQAIKGNLSDILVPVNPILALKNLIPNLVYETQRNDVSPFKIYKVCASFGGQNFEATDSFDSHNATNELARQILHSFISVHAFAKGAAKSCKSNLNARYCARLLEGMNNTIYIVGKCKNSARYMLYELKPGFKTCVTTKYDATTGTPNHVATVIINGRQLFYGSGSEKELAEKDAVHSALSSITPEDMDSLPAFKEPHNTKKKKSKALFNRKNALHALTLLQPRTESFILKKDVNSKGGTIYTARVNISGVNYDCDAGSLKSAKKNAAFKALINLPKEVAEKLAKEVDEQIASRRLNSKTSLPVGNHKQRNGLLQDPSQNIDGGIVQDDLLNTCADKQETYTAAYPKSSTTSANSSGIPEDEDHSFGDYVATLVEKAFQSLKDADPLIPPCKVLAGVVMSKGIAINGSQVVCVATGNDSISGCYLSMKGETVNDCHAVVLARRGLVSFLYDQLDKYETHPEESVFEPAGNFDGLPPRLKIKDDIRFHLYATSPPCGDACLQSDSSGSSTGRPVLGALQTKVEGVDEGTVPAGAAPLFQSFHDLSKGQRLLTMSCSDKMVRWSVVGAQGSLLSHVINPVYLHSVVIGNRSNPDSIRRAFIGRVENLKAIPYPFVLTQPFIATTSVNKSLSLFIPKYSLCWVKGWAQHELIESHKGRMKNDSHLSKICKNCFFQRFISLVSANHEWIPLFKPHLEPSGKISYGAMKKAASTFGKTNKLLVDSFAKSGLGFWVKKHAELNHFKMSFRVRSN